MTIFEATRTCFRNYIGFSGRASRSEFWKFVLFILLASMVLLIVNSVLFGPEVSVQISVTQDGTGNTTQRVIHEKLYTSGWLGDIFLLVTMLPLLAATWRRMHDIGRAGWHILLTFPLAIVLIVAVLAVAPTETMPIDTSSFGAGYSGPTEITFPVVSNWLLFSLLGLGFFTLALAIFWLCRKSRSGPNSYGPNPLEVTR